MADEQKSRLVAVNSPLGEDKLLFRCMKATEELGRLFEYKLDLLSKDGEIAPKEILGQNVTVRFELPDNETRYFNGFVSRFSQEGVYGDFMSYKVILVPWLWFLTRTANCRIFQKKSVPEIIKEVFRNHGFSDFEESLGETYQKREYCVQYRETDFNFVSRLMEQEGIYYYFSHENGKHNLTLSDSYSAHKKIKGYSEIPYYPPDNSDRRERDHIFDWIISQQVQPGTYAYNDFDFEVPKANLMSKSASQRDHKEAKFEIYDYPGEYNKSSQGDSYSRIRMEELTATYDLAFGKGNARGLAAGYLFKLTDYPREDQNREYLITSASYELSSNEYQTVSVGEVTVNYSCDFTVLDSKVQFRSARITSTPKVMGPQTAIVVGKKGEEIWTDKYGRVKVKFHWDRDSEANENSSCWVRVAQYWAGKKWGAMHIPRIGQEVIIDFLEGNPDRPIITGSVYNGSVMPPVTLPANATVSTIKSNSSKGGAGFNELRFEDKKGDEQIFLHAEKNLDMEIKNDRSDSVIGKQTVDIGKTLSLTVTDDVTEVFKKNHSEKVTKDYYIKADNIVIEASTKITIKVGQSSITIESSGVEIGTGGKIDLDAKGDLSIKSASQAEMTSPKTTVKGDATVTVQGASVTVKGDAMTTIKGGMVKIN